MHFLDSEYILTTSLKGNRIAKLVNYLPKGTQETY